MPNQGNYYAVFRKKGYPDITAWVRINQISKKDAELEAHATYTEYIVHFDDDVVFTNPIDPANPNTPPVSYIDGTTRIIWPDRLPKSALLDVPFRTTLPWNRGSATFKDEGS